MKLDSFYPIFDSSEMLARMLPFGVRLVQLRIKEKSDRELRVEITSARDLAAANDCQLVVNDYWQIAIELGCDYVHLGQEDLDGADIPAIRNADISLGVSTHSEEELERALSLGPDYIALGPVYPTILKKMPWGPQGLDRVRQWKQKIRNTPLVGIGGLSLERAPGVFDAGADVVSVVTDITLNSDPEAQVKRWIDLTAGYR